MQIKRRTIWEKKGEPEVIQIIDQRHLPHKFVIEDLRTLDDVCKAIKEMHVRGAPLIGVAAAYGMYLACLEIFGDSSIRRNYSSNVFLANVSIKDSANRLKSTRPTAINLAWAVDKVLKEISTYESPEEIITKSLEIARWITEYEVENCKKIGVNGVKLIEEIAQRKNGDTVNILTHCNAGWLATVEYGTATAPIYLAHDLGIKIHVWVDETRPRNQGAKLTAWELNQYGIPHTVIVDNAGGYLMQQGLVDIVIVGSDRTTFTGDVANKIGTYLKALAAKDNNVPFYVALPSTTIDWTLGNGIKDIPVEIRDEDEIRFVDGLIDGKILNVLVPPETSPALNIAFDITPRRLITGLITERGICKADEKSIRKLFDEPQ